MIKYQQRRDWAPVFCLPFQMDGFQKDDGTDSDTLLQNDASCNLRSFHAAEAFSRFQACCGNN